MSNIHLPLDPEYKAPPAVQAQAARAEQAFRQANGIPEPTPEIVEPPAVTPEPAPETLPPAAIAEPPAVTPEVKAPEVNWEHKYKSMEGRHNRSQEQIRAMGDQIKQLQGLLASLPEPTTPPGQTPSPVPSLITEQEETEYGKEFLDVVGKRAKQELGSEVEELRKTIKDLKSRVESSTQVATQDARTRLEDTLTTQVPNWLDINMSQEFHDWLALPDTYSGVIRHELLKSAYERNAVPQTLAFFKGFLAEEAALAPASLGVQPDQNTVDNTGKIPLETFAAPGRAKTAATQQGPTEKPSFTRPQIAAFYADVARGKYRGDDTKKNAIEAQIFAAEREGRIR